VPIEFVAKALTKYFVEAESPVRLLVNTYVNASSPGASSSCVTVRSDKGPAPSEVSLSSVSGPGVVAQQTPYSVITAPPLLEIIPPLAAVVDAMDVTTVVSSTVGLSAAGGRGSGTLGLSGLNGGGRSNNGRGPSSHVRHTMRLSHVLILSVL